MPNLSIIVSIVSLMIATASLFVATLNAFKPKIDSEYNICVSLIEKNSSLWKKYRDAAQKNEQEQETILLDILNLTEWTCIYIVSRKYLKSEPVKHLESEVLEPFIKCLGEDNETALYLRNFIKEKKTGDKTFVCLISKLSARGIRI